jgi:hypothetical protein
MPEKEKGENGDMKEREMKEVVEDHLKTVQGRLRAETIDTSQRGRPVADSLLAASTRKMESGASLDRR